MKYLLITLLSIFLVNCAKEETITIRKPILIVVGESPFLNLIQEEYPNHDIVNKGTGCMLDCNYENINNYIIMFKLGERDKILILYHTMIGSDLTYAIEFSKNHGVDADGLVSHITPDIIVP